ncbi:MAG: hypothetical protein NTZ51_08785 [Proteobacteria bacterium]|nr:hypothetical protein [Pseudomonadota bacterium]
MATYTPDDPSFVIVPFFHYRNDVMSFILKVNSNNNIILNFIIEREDYASTDALIDILAVAVDSLMQNKALLNK